MTDKTLEEKKIWSYVHDEMDAADRLAFVDAIARDESLKRAVEKAKLTEGYFRTLMPRVDDSSEATEDKILEIWERDQHMERVAPPLAGELAALPKQRFMRPLLALAACVVFSVGVYLMSPSPLQWESQELVLFKVRSPGTGLSASQYSGEEMLVFARQIKNPIEDAYPKRRQAFFRPPMWSIQLRVHELRGGMLQVELEAEHGRDPSLSKSWSKLFSSSQEYEEQVQSWGIKIAQEL